MNEHSWSRNVLGKITKTGSEGNKRRSRTRAMPKPHETEEEAILRRFHDAQRMARFRAKRKKALEEARALEEAKATEEARLAELSISISELRRRNISFQIANPVIPVPIQNSLERYPPGNLCLGGVSPSPGQSKYSQLLAVIEELGRDIRLTYAGSRTSAERLKVGIVQARMLVKDCLLETEINSR